MTTLLLRIAAGFVDAVLAVALAFLALWAAAPRLGAGGPAVVLGAPFVGTALLFFALRDVASGASLAKWIMGLRVETSRGTRAGFALRLARVPWALLPLGWVPAMERRMPWRVVAYVPSGAGLALRAALAVAGLAGTVAWATLALRPSIGRNAALQLAETTLLRDPFLGATLGAPLRAEIVALAPRGRGTWHSHEGSFQMRIHGQRAVQSMTVRARKIEGSWAVDEVTEIEVAAVDTLPHRVTSR